MRQHLTGHAVANNVRMMRTQHSGAFLIVEGPSDARLFSSMTVPGACQVLPGFGKSNVIAALNLLSTDGVADTLGIVDADFDHLEERVLAEANLLYSDIHDLDAMIFRSPALDRVLAEYGSPGKLLELLGQTGMEPRELILESAQPIGYARWVALQLGLPLKFEGLRYGDFADPLNCSVDPQRLVKALKNNSMAHDLEEGPFLARCGALRQQGYDPWQVCCGHDLISLLSFILRRGIGTNNPTDIEPEILQRSLRLAYEAAHFGSTELHGGILHWEAANPGFRVIR